jgi:predicted metalloprotease
MRWRGRRESGEIEDRRGHPVRRGGIALGGGGLLLLLVLAAVTGQNPLALLEIVDGGPRSEVDEPVAPRGTPADDLGRFASVVLASTEDAWQRHFERRQLRYEKPTLVLFSGAVESACGFSSAAVGPFYCPADRKLYLDLSFFDELERRFGAPGDFAQAYVIAHEVGHHVQNLFGIAGRVHEARQRLPAEEANALSVRLELQADCFAGVWGHDAAQTDLLEPGDVDEGLGAAAAIGDDRLQRKAQGYTVPETWTHGSSEARARWLRRGLDTGNPDTCDAFGRGAAVD